MVFGGSCLPLPDGCGACLYRQCGTDRFRISTYVVWIGEVTIQRCIHIFLPEVPLSRSEPLPVLISVKAYGQGLLEEGGEAVRAAEYYGYA